MTYENTGDDLVDKILNSDGQTAFVVDNVTVPLLSLAPGTLAAIQLELGTPDAPLSWLDMIRGPLARLDVAEALLRACAEKAEKPDPTPISDAEELVRRFVMIPNDLPPMPTVPPTDEDDDVDPTSASSTAG